MLLLPPLLLAEDSSRRRSVTNREEPTLEKVPTLLLQMSRCSSAAGARQPERGHLLAAVMGQRGMPV